MHAKHADRITLNDLSGQMIDCAFTVLNTPGAGRQRCLLLDFGKKRSEITCGRRPVKRAESSACFACIILFICVKPFLVSQRHKVSSAGQDPTRSQPPGATLNRTESRCTGPNCNLHQI